MAEREPKLRNTRKARKGEKADRATTALSFLHTKTPRHKGAGKGRETNNPKGPDRLRNSPTKDTAANVSER